ncbi:MAG: peptide chain release factor N(5)-glutamine methyltransferase [Rickettsiales bacterium]|jgi:release factor glutamine methyltransferase|nr:peptide chain release factor N(5)-glutamine methyltransferase [Rickettsiales bacterium]
MDLCTEGRKALERAGIESAAIDARILFHHAIGADPRLCRECPTEAQKTAFSAMIDRRVRREPVAYITGTRGFYGMDFLVDRSVLIPRADSEALVELALDIAPRERPLRIADLGSGSGCLVIAMLGNLASASGAGFEIDSGAIACARANAQALGMERRVEFLQADFTAPIDLGSFDIILSNPPYVPTAEARTLMPDVREFEPWRAIDGGEDGLCFYRAIAAQEFPAGAKIILEIGEGQGEAVREIFRGMRFSGGRRDLSGCERALCFTAI